MKIDINNTTLIKAAIKINQQQRADMVKEQNEISNRLRSCNYLAITGEHSALNKRYSYLYNQIEEIDNKVLALQQQLKKVRNSRQISLFINL